MNFPRRATGRFRSVYCRSLAVLGIVVGATAERAGARGGDPPKGTAAEGRKLSHEETLQWVADHKAWRPARKTKPIWARRIDENEVGREFQTADGVQEKARAGYWLCVGVAGEPWFQSRERLVAKYDERDERTRRFNFDDQPRNYQRFQPKPSNRNWVAQVNGPGIAGFFVRPHYDPERPLYAPAGGYVVKDAVADPYRDQPGDVWLVQQPLFESTYELIPDTRPEPAPQPE